MFGINRFSAPYPTFQRPVPLVLVSPDDAPDYTVCFRKEWLPYVTGSIRALMQEATWNTSDDLLLAEQLQRANMLLAIFIEGCTPEEREAILESDYEMAVCEQLRFQNGKLQGLCCGEWTDISGQPAQGFQPAGSGTGTTPPVSGGCENYTASMNGNGLFYAPFTVSTGDTIAITEAAGATYNPANTNWYLLNGNQFFAGLDVGFPITAGGNPMPAVPSGKLIAKIGATFYDVNTGGVFTVPAGISNQPVQFQVNYATIAGSAGDVNFKIGYCNNSATSFTHTFDFALSAYGWAVQVQGAGAVGSWVAGTGFVFGDATFGGNNVRTVSIVKTPIPARTLTDIKSYIDYTYGSVTDPTVGIQRIDTNVSTWVSKTNANYIAGSNQLLEGIKTEAGVTAISNLMTSYRVATGAQSGNIVIRKIVVSGIGSDPF